MSRPPKPKPGTPKGGVSKVGTPQGKLSDDKSPMGCLKRIVACVQKNPDDVSLKQHFELTKLYKITTDENARINEHEKTNILGFIESFKNHFRKEKRVKTLVKDLEDNQIKIGELLTQRTQIIRSQSAARQEERLQRGQQPHQRYIPEQHPNDVRRYHSIEDGRSRQFSQGDRENSQLHQLLIQQQQEIKALQKQMKEKDLEIESVTNRLSAEMNSKVSGNETFLENISVKKRPMAVSEAYQNFFSTTWTDAKNTLDEIWPRESETMRLSCLCKIFIDSYQFCEELKRRCKVHAYIVDDETEWKEKITSDERSQAFKQSAFDQWKSTGEGIKIPEKSLQQILSKYRVLDGRGHVADSVRNFAEAAVNLTWEMVIQKPPMTLDTSAIGERWTTESHLELAWGSQQPNKGTIQCYVFPTVKHGGKVMVRGKVLVL